jgi:hypothetical protein
MTPSINAHIQTATDFCRSIFTETDTIINEYSGKDNMKFPDLINLVSIKLAFAPELLPQVDPFIRYYVRSNPEFHTSRGAKGGIERMSVYQARVKAQQAKSEAKKQITELLEAKLKGPISSPSMPAMPSQEIEEEIGEMSL